MNNTLKPSTIQAMLSLDPLREAENMTGKSYKTDEKTAT